MAAFSSGMPEAGVYFVLPSFRALIAASLMYSGVSKSGSPAPKPTTSMPWAFISLARLVTASVADGATFLALWLIFIWRHLSNV